ncbi:MAG: hypothetical protein ACYDEF_01660 [Methanosarcina sp.]
MEIYRFEESTKDMGQLFQSHRLYEYLQKLNAQTVIAEKNYIDKDYIIDYSYFYARSFHNYGPFTTRLHFFETNFTKEDFIENFHSDKKFQEKLVKSYLGFMVLKPIGFSPEKRLIGRTILKTKFLEENGANLIKSDSSVSLYGLQFNLSSLPYQIQDKVVAACATTAIWTSLHALNKVFGTQKQSPFEITKTSVSFLGMERNFPSKGLDIFQIKNYFNSIGMETEYLNVENRPEVITDAIMAYLSYGLPVITGIKLIRKDGSEPDLHAVVISGYHCNKNGEIDKLYVHDDQIGPYTEVYPNEKYICFSHWINEWIFAEEYKNKYKDIVVECLLIPLYPKIRISFNKIYDILLDYKKESKKEGILGITYRLFLTDVSKYKKYLLNQSIEDKREILMSKLPRFLWIVRSFSEEQTLFDFVFDATSPFINDTICEINYLEPPPMPLLQLLLFINDIYAKSTILKSKS